MIRNFVGLRYIDRDGETILQYGTQLVRLIGGTPEDHHVHVAYAGEVPVWHDVPTVAVDQQ